MLVYQRVNLNQLISSFWFHLVDILGSGKMLTHTSQGKIAVQTLHPIACGKVAEKSNNCHWLYLQIPSGKLT